jgi:hypothetical protein
MLPPPRRVNAAANPRQFPPSTHSSAFIATPLERQDLLRVFGRVPVAGSMKCTAAGSEKPQGRNRGELCTIRLRRLPPSVPGNTPEESRPRPERY